MLHFVGSSASRVNPYEYENALVLTAMKLALPNRQISIVSLLVYYFSPLNFLLVVRRSMYGNIV